MKKVIVSLILSVFFFSLFEWLACPQGLAAGLGVIVASSTVAGKEYRGRR